MLIKAAGVRFVCLSSRDEKREMTGHNRSSDGEEGRRIFFFFFDARGVCGLESAVEKRGAQKYKRERYAPPTNKEENKIIRYAFSVFTRYPPLCKISLVY